jgi:alpha-beta hydrolase superfamily lysophospholipase
MRIFLAAFGYYVAGSVIAGSILGAGFATNLSRLPNDGQLKSLQRIGTYIPLNLDGVEGGLIAKAGERRPTIIYLHGRSANRMELAPLAEAMFNQGYNAVLWDSKGRQISYGPKEIEQVHRIVGFIRKDPHVVMNDVFIIGFSLGAAIAIGAASADTDHYIRGIVADSPYANLKDVASRYVTAFGVIPTAVVWPARAVTFATAKAMHGIEFESLNPADWARGITCPVFLVHGKSDKTIPYKQSEQILQKLDTYKKLWLVEGTGHTKAFSSSPAEYVRRVVDFLNGIRASGNAASFPNQ